MSDAPKKPNLSDHLQKNTMDKETLEKDSNKQIIEEAFTQALGKKVRVQCVVTEREGATQETPEDRVSDKDEGVPDIVSKALEIFDGSKVVRKD